MMIIILFHSDVVHLNFSSSNQIQVHLIHYVPSRSSAASSFRQFGRKFTGHEKEKNGKAR